MPAMTQATCIIEIDLEIIADLGHAIRYLRPAWREHAQYPDLDPHQADRFANPQRANAVQQHCSGLSDSEWMIISSLRYATNSFSMSFVTNSSHIHRVDLVPRDTHEEGGQVEDSLRPSLIQVRMSSMAAMIGDMAVSTFEERDGDAQYVGICAPGTGREETCMISRPGSTTTRPKSRSAHAGRVWTRPSQCC